MKTTTAILLLLLPMTAGLQAKDEGHAQNNQGSSEQNAAPTLADTLAAQVKEIASSESMSRKSQAKLITNAIRLAITTATEGIKDPSARLQLAMELTTAATTAAPQFAATITSAVSGIPSIAKIDGALDSIKDAVKKGQEQGEEPEVANPSRDHGHREHEFDGPDKGEHIVSPSAPSKAK